MRVKPPSHIISASLPPKNRDDGSRSNAINVIRTTLRSRPRVELVFVLLSSGDKHIYNGIKRLGDLELDVHTVCVHWDKFSKNNVQYQANVALKFNIKLGGVNHLLDERSMAWLRTKTTMVMGIDVTKPGPGSTPGTPSIAAVVASIDDRFAQFPASLSLQAPDWDKDSKEVGAPRVLTSMTLLTKNRWSKISQT